MGRIAPGAEVGVVGRFEDDLAAGLQDAVQFFHRRDDVTDAEKADLLEAASSCPTTAITVEVVS